MATISIARKHSLTHKKARDVAEKIAKDLRKRFDLDYEWHGDHIDFERPGGNGRGSRISARAVEDHGSRPALGEPEGPADAAAKKFEG